MNCWRLASNVFAAFLLVFVNLISAHAQSVYDVQAGTLLRVAMDNEVSSKVARVNDTFTATVTEPLIIREVLVLPVGTVVEGRILKAKSASAGGRNGNLTVSFETMRLADGTKLPIEAVLVSSLKVNSSPKLKVAAVAGTTAFGTIIGAVSKQKNGALFGAGIGAGAGIGFALLQKGSNVRIKADEKFEIKLVKNVTLPARDF